MLIREVMHPDPISIPKETSLSDAYQLMHEKGIRHLPVVEGEKIVGVVTDRDLRLATSKLTEHPFDPGVAVENVMSAPVQTAHPSDPIGSATQMMRELKIGCLPVVENGELVGIVTGMDILDAMLILMGMDRPSGRMDVRLSDKPGELARLSQLLSERGVNIHSILSYPEKDGRMRLVLRVNTMEIRPIASAVCNSDFEVLWPPHISCAE
ncbi:MAG: CBS domain-containing protein [Chlorobi bacterium]|nr:CBS domain-containing protein [Chlorobiota bacterium]